MRLLLTPDWQPGITALTERLVSELEEGKRVVWLVPGGSNIKAAVSAAALLPEVLTEQLVITLSDERYGEVDHPDSNWRQLREAGFDVRRAKGIPVLVPGLDLEATRAAFEESLSEELLAADAIIAHLGMGPDGHIAGILPGTPSVTAAQLVAAYEAPNYTRITTTPSLLRRVTAAYVMAFGAEKREAIERLETDVNLTDQPAQILKEIPESYVYNDQKGEAV